MTLNLAVRLTKIEYFLFLCRRVGFWAKIRGILFVYVGLIIVINLPSLFDQAVPAALLVNLFFGTLLSVAMVTPLIITFQALALVYFMWEYRQEISQEKTYTLTQEGVTVQSNVLTVEYAWEFFGQMTQDKIGYYLQPKVKSSWALVMLPKRVFLNIQRRQEFEKLVAQKLRVSN